MLKIAVSRLLVSAHCQSGTGAPPRKEDARGEGQEHRVECLCAGLKPYLRVLRGLSNTTLPGYLGCLQWLRNCRQQNAFAQAALLVQAALAPAMTRRAQKEECGKCLDHFDLLHTAIN